MPTVYIPPQIRGLTGGIETIEIRAGSVREIVVQLEERFPGVRDRLCQGDELRPGLSVSVGSQISSLGLYQRVSADAEVHFIPAIGGG
jgi:molybdopterin synthase sulfur carrier subunit